jgi:hypothetical protein
MPVLVLPFKDMKLYNYLKTKEELFSDVADMIFSGMLGASVMYGMDRSIDNLKRTIDSLIEYVDSLAV